VLDDIKGSVRIAAMGLCRVLTNISVRLVEAASESSTKNAENTLKIVLPFLLSPSGLENPSKEVQIFAVDTLLKLLKAGGDTLRPFISNLVERLISLLTTFEPAEVNYLHLNAAKYNTTEEKVSTA